MKYALIKNNIVEQISYQPVDGWEQVSDNVCADMVKKSDGTFDNTDEVKQQISQAQTEQTNKETNRTSAINKLKGATYSALTDAEAKALFGE